MLLVEHHTEAREALAAVLSASFDLVGVLDSVDSIERHVAEYKVEVVALDIDVQAKTGVAGVQRILEWFPDVKVIALSSIADAVYVREIFKAGAAGYVLKLRAAGDLPQAVNETTGGRRYVSPSVGLG
ncbi:MAG: response regulator [Bryobacterales bacterium]